MLALSLQADITASLDMDIKLNNQIKEDCLYRTQPIYANYIKETLILSY